LASPKASSTSSIRSTGGKRSDMMARSNIGSSASLGDPSGRCRQSIATYLIECLSTRRQKALTTRVMTTRTMLTLESGKPLHTQIFVLIKLT
jgi:hypothetical protein